MGTRVSDQMMTTKKRDFLCCATLKSGEGNPPAAWKGSAPLRTQCQTPIPWPLTPFSLRRTSGVPAGRWDSTWMVAGKETVAFLLWSVTVGASFTHSDSRSCWPGGNFP